VNLFRYHYGEYWEKNNPLSRKRTKKSIPYYRLLENYRAMLIRYGFHGYGNPADDNGIVVFAEDRLILKELVVDFTRDDYLSLFDKDFRPFENTEKLRVYFAKQGSTRAKELAAQIAVMDAKEL
jgi:hypothetical protein